jgi:hypothetical protein
MQVLPVDCGKQRSLVASYHSRKQGFNKAAMLSPASSLEVQPWSMQQSMCYGITPILQQCIHACPALVDGSQMS